MIRYCKFEIYSLYNEFVATSIAGNRWKRKMFHPSCRPLLVERFAPLIQLFKCSYSENGGFVIITWCHIKHINQYFKGFIPQDPVLIDCIMWKSIFPGLKCKFEKSHNTLLIVLLPFSLFWFRNPFLTSFKILYSY